MVPKPQRTAAAECKKRYIDSLREAGEHHLHYDIFKVEFPPFCPVQNQYNTSFRCLPAAEKEKWLYRFVRLYLRAAGRKKRRKEALSRLVGYRLAERVADDKLYIALPNLHDRLDCCFMLAPGRFGLLFTVLGGFQALDRVATTLNGRFGAIVHQSMEGPDFLPVAEFPFKTN